MMLQVLFALALLSRGSAMSAPWESIRRNWQSEKRQQMEELRGNQRRELDKLPENAYKERHELRLQHNWEVLEKEADHNYQDQWIGLKVKHEVAENHLAKRTYSAEEKQDLRERHSQELKRFEKKHKDASEAAKKERTRRWDSQMESNHKERQELTEKQSKERERTESFQKLELELTESNDEKEKLQEQQIKDMQALRELQSEDTKRLEHQLNVKLLKTRTEPRTGSEEFVPVRGRREQEQRKKAEDEERMQKERKEGEQRELKNAEAARAQESKAKAQELKKQAQQRAQEEERERARELKREEQQRKERTTFEIRVIQPNGRERGVTQDKWGGKSLAPEGTAEGKRFPWSDRVSTVADALKDRYEYNPSNRQDRFQRVSLNDSQCTWPYDKALVQGKDNIIVVKL